MSKLIDLICGWIGIIIAVTIAVFAAMTYLYALFLLAVITVDYGIDTYRSRMISAKPSYKISAVIIDKTVSKEYAANCIEQSINILQEPGLFTISPPEYFTRGTHSCDKFLWKNNAQSDARLLNVAYHNCLKTHYKKKGHDKIRLVFAPHTVSDSLYTGATTKNNQCRVPVNFTSLQIGDNLPLWKCVSLLTHEIAHELGVLDHEAGSPSNIMTARPQEKEAWDNRYFSKKTINGFKECNKRRN